MISRDVFSTAEPLPPWVGHNAGSIRVYGRWRQRVSGTFGTVGTWPGVGAATLMFPFRSWLFPDCFQKRHSPKWLIFK